MLAVLLATLVAGPTVNDFFPLVVGQRRTYEQEVRQGSKVMERSVTEDETKASVALEAGPTFLVETRNGGRLVTNTYYRIEGNSLMLVGFDPKHLLPRPQPILVLEGDKGAWTYDGPVSTAKDADMIHVVGDAKLKGERMVLGKKVPVVEVHVKATLGGGALREDHEETTLYAKGIGLVENTVKTSFGRKTLLSVTKLVRFEEAKSTG